MSDTLTNSQNVSTSGGHGDDIITLIDHASPRPWRVLKYKKRLDGHCAIYDKNGDAVDIDDNLANSTLVVEAVNEYDGKHTFCTQDCVWMSGEIRRLQDCLISIHDIAEDAFGGPEREREAIQSHALDLIETSARKALGLDVYGGIAK